MKKEKWLNIPNILTSVRILIVPLLFYVFFLPNGKGRNAVLLLFLLAGLTDSLDGLIARKYNQVTMLGKVLDPIADKLTIAALLIFMVCMHIITWPALAIIAAKEIYMAIGAAICLKRKMEVSADMFGKVSTALFYPSVIMAWPWHGVLTISVIGSVLVYVSLALSLLASAHYTIQSVKKWNEMKAH